MKRIVLLVPDTAVLVTGSHDKTYTEKVPVTADLIKGLCRANAGYHDDIYFDGPVTVVSIEDDKGQHKLDRRK